MRIEHVKLQIVSLSISISSLIIISKVFADELSSTNSNNQGNELFEKSSSFNQNSNRIEYLEAKLNQLREDVLKLQEELNQQNSNVYYDTQSNFSPTTTTNHQNNIKPSEKVNRLIAPTTSYLDLGDQRGQLLYRGKRQSTKQQQRDDSRQASFFRGERGEPGRNGIDGLPGADGAPGLDGVPGKDGRNGRDGLNGKEGRDGKDGTPGERGPQGPPGSQGETGKRGKPGPQGKTGPPGPPGVCAYKAKFDCSMMKSTMPPHQGGFDKKLPNSHNESNSSPDAMRGLLLAPTMIGQEFNNQAESAAPPMAEERLVTVTEGDNIQLSCEAHGQPKPNYMWQKRRTLDQSSNNQLSTILLDFANDLRATSFPGGQLPFFEVDRLQGGNYECIASNGIPPNSIKRINLDVMYKPTVRISPGSAKPAHKVSLGSTIQIDCIVESNPSAFTYWMHDSDLIMSVAANSAIQQAQETPATSSTTNNLVRTNRHWNNVITESTGQLSNGASYSIVTLNITNIGHNDLGLYKCISKNLIGRTIGYLRLIEVGNSNYAESGKLGGSSSSINNSNTLNLESDDDFSESKGGDWIVETSLDPNLGWPSSLTEERQSSERLRSYSTFGNSHRQRQQPNENNNRKPPLSPNLLLSALSSIYNVTAETVTQSPSQSTRRLSDDELTGGLQETGSGPPNLRRPLESISHNRNKSNRKPTQADDVSDPEEEEASESCRFEWLNQEEDNSKKRNNERNKLNSTEILLLDQVGKPVYLGSLPKGSVNWWSVDSSGGLKEVAKEKTTNANSVDLGGELDQVEQEEEQAKQTAQVLARYYATSPSYKDKLFEYSSLADLFKDQQQQQQSFNLPIEPIEQQQTSVADGGVQPPSKNVHKLKRPFDGNSHLIYNGLFIYTSIATNESNNNNNNNKDLRALTVVVFNIKTGEEKLLKLTDSSSGSKAIRDLGISQPLNLNEDSNEDTENFNYNLNRIELASDENGVWIVLPTIEQQQIAPTKSSSSSKLNDDESTRKTRRLHVMKLKRFEELFNSANKRIEIDYHVSLRLDWRMIGQLFIIDGVLYGIKDRHLYSSKLQFAYDLFRCKLLTSEYLNEPHRTFTNHFGNTQMIKYNPNEPKRLYTIDNGNLLWCPVKLIKTKPDDIWQQNNKS